MYIVRISFFVMACLLFSSCELFREDTDQNPHYLQASLDVEPDAVDPGGKFVAVYRLNNNSDDDMEVISNCAEVARGKIYRNDHLMDFYGTSPFCIERIGFHEIEAGDTLEKKWTVKAMTVTHTNDSADTTFAKPGEYQFNVKHDVYMVDGREIELPTLQRTIEVK